MKKISIVLFTCAALALSVGCTREAAPKLAEGGIVVNLHVDGMETKAETTILPGWLYLFDNVANPPFATVEIDGSKTTTLSFATHFGSEEDLVKRTTVFAVTGYPEITDALSLADIKSRAVTPLFLDGNAVKADPNFYMTAEGNFEKVDDNTTTCNLSLKRLAAKLTLEVDYTPSITTHGTMDFNGTSLNTTTTWEPITTGQNVRVYLQNAVKNAVLGAASDTPVYPASFSTFTYDPVYMNGAAVSAPFYTYPLTWAEGGNKEPFIKLIQPWRFETVDDATGAVVNSNVVELYYKVMVPASMTSFAANTWYQPKVTLNVLGGEADRPATIVADEFQVLAWKDVDGTSGLSDVAVTDAKFISVSASNIEKTGTNEYTVSLERGVKSSFEVIASGPVTYDLQDISFTKYITTPNVANLSQVGDPDYAGTGKEDEYIVKDGAVQSAYFSLTDDDDLSPLDWLAFTPGTKGGTLELKHTLSSSMSSKNFAVTDYVYKVELKLDAENSIILKIKQSPAIQLSNQLSEAYVFINNQSNRSSWSNEVIEVKTTYNFYQTKNVTTKPSATNVIGELVGPSLKGSANKCKFRFLLDVVPYDTEHPITDTRASITGDFAYAFTSKSGDPAWGYGATAPSMQAGVPIIGNDYDKIATETKINYKGGTENYDYVSPGFMVASSYGGYSNNVLFGGALLRCATYQEDGYPAGRWRLPTEAELKLMVELQKQGYMPEVFVPNTWASSGRYYTGSEFMKVKSKVGYTVRCVYDTWYWGKDPVPGAKTTYTVMVN